tara:strand:- start:1201 stop:1512 length:312 start_codon:yes stop_codon:yes gene_type:complete
MAKEGLKKWFSRNDGKGWIDCKTGKPCGRKSATKSKRPYPACRPTKAQCNEAAKKKTSKKRISWQKKKNGGEMILAKKNSRIAKGCGKVMSDRRKRTKQTYYV